MWSSLNIAWNRVVNTAAIPVRVAWTAVTTVSDLWNTLYTMPKESYEIMADTTQEVKNTLLWAWNHGKRYHKAMNIPLSPVIATWAALEWVVRSTVQPLVNGVVNTRNTWKNTVKNARKGTFGRVFSKKPISDFSYDHMQTRWLKLNNRISKWQFGKWKSTVSKWESAPQIEKKIEDTIWKSEPKEEKKKSSRWKKSEWSSRWGKSKDKSEGQTPTGTLDQNNWWTNKKIKEKDDEIVLLKKQLDDANKNSDQKKWKIIEMKNNKEEKKDTENSNARENREVKKNDNKKTEKKEWKAIKMKNNKEEKKQISKNENKKIEKKEEVELWNVA